MKAVYWIVLLGAGVAIVSGLVKGSCNLADVLICSFLAARFAL